LFAADTEPPRSRHEQELGGRILVVVPIAGVGTLRPGHEADPFVVANRRDRNACSIREF